MADVTPPDDAADDAPAPDTVAAEEAELEAAQAASPSGVPHEEEIDFASYVFPDPKNRRITAYALAFIGASAIGIWAVTHAAGVISNGALIGGVVMLGLAVWFWIAAFPLGLDQGEALVIATREIGFPVGHASAVLGWRGWRAKPMWQILLYSTEDPPLERGLVALDAVSGEILDSYHESNPEDWDALRAEDDAL